MHKDTFNEEIGRIEKVFGQKENVYDEAVLVEIYGAVRHLSEEQWKAIVGGVIRTWSYKTLPNTSAFEKMKNELGPQGQPIRRIRADCPKCNGDGRRYFIYKVEGGFDRAVALCVCDNSENHRSPPFMRPQETERLPAFQQWVNPGEVARLLASLNPPRQMPEKKSKKPGEKPGISGISTGRDPGISENGQNGRDATQNEKTSIGSRKTAAVADGPAGRPESKVGQEFRTLPEAAATLAARLGDSRNVRQGNPEDRQDARASDMVQELNEWIEDDDGPCALS